MTFVILGEHTSCTGEGGFSLISSGIRSMGSIFSYILHRNRLSMTMLYLLWSRVRNIISMALASMKRENESVRYAIPSGSHSLKTECFMLPTW